MLARWIAIVAAALMVGLVSLPSDADAGKNKKKGSGKVERTFGGKVLTSNKRFPSSAKSESEYISKLKKQVKDKFQEDKEKKEWKIHFAAFFKKPLGDLEYTVRLYDITDGQHLVSSFEQYTDSPDQTSLLSYLILERRQFGVNKRILMTIESKGKVVASGRFMILGEAERYTGKADFTEDEGEE